MTLESRRCQTLELNRPCACRSWILLKDEERGNARPLVRVSVQQIEHSAQDAIAAALRVMQFMSRRLVITEVNELPCIQVEVIRPVTVLSARVEYDELFVLA